MLYRILTIAIIVLVSWQLVQEKRNQLALQSQLSILNTVLMNPEASEEQQKQNRQTTETLLQLQESLQNIEGKQKEKFQSKLDQAAKTVGLYQTLGKFDEIESLITQEKPADAADLIIKTKDAIWKAGDFFTSQQKELRGMMGPIDAAGTNWKQGKMEPTVKELKESLAQIIQNIGEKS